MNKKLKIIPLILALTILFIQVPLAFAAVSLYMSNPLAAADGWTSGMWGTSTNQSLGRCFTGNDEYLYSFSMYWRNDSNAETGTMRGVIFDELTGLQPTDGVQPLGYSTNIYNLANLQAETEIIFNFTDSYLLNSSQTYAIGVWMTVAAGTSFEWAQSDTGGSWYSSDPATYNYNTHSYSPCFYLYTSSSQAFGTPTPGPLPTSGSYTYDSTDDLINTLAGYLVPLLTFLLPAFILGWVTRWQKWPILIGLAVGSGLTYLFLGSQYLWLVLLVTIGIGASAYQSSRGSG